MTRLIAILALGVLTACGADGEPIQPSMNTNIGVGPGGVSGSTGLTLKKGNLSLGLGTGF